MTRTRSDRRTAEREHARTARRDSLLVLLSRAERGVLSPAEAALLRTTVEAELVEGDAARRAAGGQQAAVRRMQQRIDAAEQAIVEAEEEADALRYANYLAAAQRACGTPDWPSLSDHIAARMRAPQPALSENAA
ncbi:hypothetical protein [Streptomyces sioyaensis]|uniref:hypothetical protein n=1 Tax=Streptomyces sioyaensis TaxID=67364 RepID=UPI003D740497